MLRNISVFSTDSSYQRHWQMLHHLKLFRNCETLKSSKNFFHSSKNYSLEPIETEGNGKRAISSSFQQSSYPLHQKLMINCRLTSKAKLKNWEEKLGMMVKKLLFMIRHHNIHIRCIVWHFFSIFLCRVSIPFEKRRTQVENLIFLSTLCNHWQGIKICWLKIQFRSLSEPFPSHHLQPGKSKTWGWKFSEGFFFQRLLNGAWRRRSTCYDSMRARLHENSIKLNGKLYQQFSSSDWHHLKKIKRHRIDPCVCIIIQVPPLRSSQLLLNYFYGIFYEHHEVVRREAGLDVFMFMALWCLFCATIRHYSWCH